MSFESYCSQFFTVVFVGDREKVEHSQQRRKETVPQRTHKL